MQNAVIALMKQLYETILSWLEKLKGSNVQWLMEGGKAEKKLKSSSMRNQQSMDYQ